MALVTSPASRKLVSGNLYKSFGSFVGVQQQCGSRSYFSVFRSSPQLRFPIYQKPEEVKENDEATTIEKISVKELDKESKREIAQEAGQAIKAADIQKIRESTAKIYLKNHIPLAQTSLRQYGPPFTDTKVIEAAHVPLEQPPSDSGDRLALGVMNVLRVFVHLFFREKYLHHAVVLETVAAVPGMVSGMLRHFGSLRRMSDDNKIDLLLEEAENERHHLMIWMKVTQPTFLERMLVLAAQFGWTSFYGLAYIVSPAWCHRLIGYLEQEADIQYTHLLKAIDAGTVPNLPAPEIAKKYYNLSPEAMLRDVVVCVRADEAAHRDFNHELADHLKAGIHYYPGKHQ